MSPSLQPVFRAFSANLSRALDAFAQQWLTRFRFDAYRPELHYMRGPGPKWREKHARASGLVS